MRTIDCPTCDRMGRVTVITQSGHLTTQTCGDCNGEGVRFDCNDPSCRYCAAIQAGMQPNVPLFEWTTRDVYA